MSISMEPELPSVQEEEKTEGTTASYTHNDPFNTKQPYFFSPASHDP